MPCIGWENPNCLTLPTQSPFKILFSWQEWVMILVSDLFFMPAFSTSAYRPVRLLQNSAGCFVWSFCLLRSRLKAVGWLQARRQYQVEGAVRPRTAAVGRVGSLSGCLCHACWGSLAPNAGILCWWLEEFGIWEQGPLTLYFVWKYTALPFYVTPLLYSTTTKASWGQPILRRRGKDFMMPLKLSKALRCHGLEWAENRKSCGRRLIQKS